jgi:hypothetical protein
VYENVLSELGRSGAKMERGWPTGIDPQAQLQTYQYLPFGAVVRRSMHGPEQFWSIPGYVLQGGGASNYGPIAPTGTGTTTLSDQCETEWGFIPPAPVLGASALGWEYHPEIVSLLGAVNSLAALPTTARAVGSRVEIILTVAGGEREGSSWELRGGAADPADPGDVEPLDYNLATNKICRDKHMTTKITISPPITNTG